jgi:hypothetical protein
MTALVNAESLTKRLPGNLQTSRRRDVATGVATAERVLEIQHGSIRF